MNAAVTKFIADAPADRTATLRALRTMITKAIPQAE